MAIGTMSSSSAELNGMRIFSWLLIIFLAGIAIDLYGLIRIRSFEQTTPEIRHVSGYASLLTARKHGTLLHIESKDGSFDLSCNVPGLGGSHSCEYRRAPSSGVLSDVDWVLAPGGVFYGTLRYPVAVRQGGEQIYQVSLHQVAMDQSRRVVGDIEFLCFASSFAGLLLVAGAIRRRVRRNAGRVRSHHG